MQRTESGGRLEKLQFSAYILKCVVGLREGDNQTSADSKKQTVVVR